ARLEPAKLLRLTAVHRREHDAKFSWTLLLQLLEDGVPVEGGEVDVEEQQRRLCRAVRVHRFEQIQCFAAVAKVQKPVPARLEAEREQLGQRGIVLDDDDFRYVARLVAVRRRGGDWRRRGGEGRRGCRRSCCLLGKERRRKPPNISARGLAAVCDAIPRVLEPLLGGFLELGGDDRGLGESERPGGAAQTMS